MACSVSTIAAIVDSTYVSVASGYVGPDQSITVEATGSPVMVVAAALFDNIYTAIASGNPDVTSPWTESLGIRSNNTHALWTAGYVLDDSPPPFPVDWSGSPGHSRLIAISIPTEAATPVQTKGAAANVALVADSTPTNGTLGILVRFAQGSGPPPFGDITGWTRVASADVTTGGEIAMYVRCNGASESTTIHGADATSDNYHWYQEWTITAIVPVADFSGVPSSGTAPLSVAFTDLSSNSPTSWLWDFGDGSTSTAQHPTHEYAANGTYTVSLTATNADGSDTETKVGYIGVTADVGYEPPTPAGAIVEIYAADPGSARWDIAQWDEASWSGARWHDVTPEAIDVLLYWGSSQPELGILSRPDAGSWSIAFYDPDRRLDPSNVEGPFYGDLEPGLPIRVNHRGITVRQGVAESIGHSFLDGVTRNGYIRVTDNLSRLANAAIPSDSTLSDTLWARARDVITVAGLTVEVLPDPPSGDPALAAWVTDENEWSAWQWIQDAAEQVLHIPYIDRRGRLGFRAWALPRSRGMDIAAPELVDLQVITDYKGLFSVIQGTDLDGTTIVERALTPTPRYGTRTYLRTSKTPDVGDWAEAVLEDRGIGGLRWVPGEVFPLTADSVERLATIEAVELVSLSDDTQDPPVAVDAIIVGGQVRVTAKREDAAVWMFTYEAAQVPALPLVVSGSDPPEFLLRTGGGEYLYPS